MSRDNKAMQDDDTANPGMLWVLDGEALWRRKAGAAGKSCADCHGDAKAQHERRRGALSGVRRRARPAVNLEQRINLCRTRAPEGARRSPTRARSCWR